MNWKVVVRADNPDQQTLSTLEELTGLGRGEVLLALRRSGLVAADGLGEDRARILAANLGSGFNVSCTVLPSPGASGTASTSFRVVLTGYQPGQRAKLRETLEKLSGLPPEQVVLWLAKIPFVLKDSVDHETARRIKRMLSDAGGIVELKPLSGPVQPQASDSARSLPPRESRPAARPVPGARTHAAEPTVQAAPTDPPDQMPEPPALPETRWSSEAPPALCFSAPGRAAAVPPRLPSREELTRIPPEGALRPPVCQCTPPPPPSSPHHLYLGRPSPLDRTRVADALCSVLDFRREEAEVALDSSPAWILTVASFEKAAEIATRLESCRATVLVSGNPPAPVAGAPGGALRPGFLRWLRANG